MSSNTTTPIGAVTKIAEAITSAYGSLSSASLSEYTKSTRLTPIVLVDTVVANHDPATIKTLLQTVLTIYSSHYLQAMSMANIQSATVKQNLNHFSTDYNFSMESVHCDIDDSKPLSMPNYAPHRRQRLSSYKITNEADSSAKLNIKPLVEPASLAVGKELMVEVVIEQNKIAIPITVTILPKFIHPSDFLGIVKSSSHDRTAAGRWHKWRAGEITFWREYIFCLDQLKADRDDVRADKTGYLSNAKGRNYKAVGGVLLSNKASPNRASSVVIISSATAKQAEGLLNGPFSKTKIRQKFFESSYAMLLVVADLVYERFTFYQRGVEGYGVYTLDDLDVGSNKNVNDIESMMKAWQTASSLNL